MSLKYPFREVFRRRILRPKRLWAVLEGLDARLSSEESKSAPSLDDLGLTTAEAVFTYEDESTETVTFIIENSD